MSTVVPTNAPSVFEVLSSLTALERQAIVRPTDPPPGIAGFLFDIVEDDEANLRSEITNHYLEDNTAIQDQIALLPEEVTVRGLVAELVAIQPGPASRQNPQPNALPIDPSTAPLTRPAQAQTLVASGSLARSLAPGPTQTPAVAQALGMTPEEVETAVEEDAQGLSIDLGIDIDEARATSRASYVAAANTSAASVSSTPPSTSSGASIPPTNPVVAPSLGPSPSSLYGVFEAKAGQPPGQTRQAGAFAYVYQLWQGRQLFSVETPWGFFTDMAVLSVSARQDDESRFKSTLTLTFKKIRTAGAATITAGQIAGRAAYQSAPVTQNGTAGQTPVSETDKQSLLYRMTQGR